MKPISPKAQQLVEAEAPDFYAAVQQVLALREFCRHRVPILSTLAEFADNPLLLYACLWYAQTHQISVLFDPPVSSREPKKSKPQESLLE